MKLGPFKVKSTSAASLHALRQSLITSLEERYDLHHGLAGCVPKCMFRIGGHLDEIVRSCLDPLELIAALRRHLNISRKQEKALDIGMAVKRHREARRDGAQHDARPRFRFFRWV